MSENRLIAGDRTSVSCHLFISIMHLSSGKVSDVTRVSSQVRRQGAAWLRRDEIKRQREHLLGRECDAEASRLSCSWISPRLWQENILFAFEKAKKEKKSLLGKRYPRSRIAAFITAHTDLFIVHVAANYWEFWRSLCCWKGCIIKQ